MLIRFVLAMVRLGRSHPWATLLVGALLCLGSAWFASARLTMTTDTAELFDPDLPFRQADSAYYALFPGENQSIVVVVDAPSALAASDAAERLAVALRRHPGTIEAVREPMTGHFFRTHGWLYLSTADLALLSERLVSAQPLLGTMAAQPTAVGFLTLVDRALDAGQQGEALALDMAPALLKAAESIGAAALGQTRALDWTSLVPLDPAAVAPRALLLVSPRLDFSRVGAGTDASALIRVTAMDLGLTPEAGIRVRLTGPTPLEDEEFQTIAQGTTLAGIVSAVLVLSILIAAVRTVRHVGAILLVLGMGLVVTAGWAALSVGRLNLISIAFAVMFVGIAVDFGIQFCLRYRDERVRAPDAATALDTAATKIARAEAISAATIAVGFFAFLPTDYRGVAELGIIAGGGMIIALLLTITMLPALVMVLKPPGEREPPGFAWAQRPNDWLLVHRRPVLAGAGVLLLAGLALLPQLRVDFDPLKLKDPQTESMRTLRDLMGDPWATPNTLSLLSPDLAAADARAVQLRAMPEVRDALTLSAFIPEDQDAKLAILQDLAFLLEPSLVVAPGQTSALDQMRALLGGFQARLIDARADPVLAPELRVAITALERAIADVRPQLEGRDGAAVLARMDAALAGRLPALLDRLRDGLQAGPVTQADLPEDIRQSWIATDGRYRVQVYGRGDLSAPDGLAAFTRAVTAVAPDAIGPPVLILETGRVVMGAFLQAAVLALAGVFALLWIAHRSVPDVLRTLSPLLLASVLTLATCAAIGLPLTFANVIGLPLLLGIGVSYPIYLVALWRSGDDRLLASAVARAVLFSGLTTLAAFGSLALSDHPGTAGLGILLALALTYTLLATMILLPALLGPRPGAGPEPR